MFNTGDLYCGAMRITKFGHACVRLETDGHVIVLDPGGFTEPEAVDGATAVLITHEHADHYSADHLRRTDAPIHTIAAVAAKIREDAPGRRRAGPPWSRPGSRSTRGADAAWSARSTR